MRITPAEFFAARWTCFWATAFQFEPSLFEQFLFRRLGDPPLNVTLLLDADKLAETWSSMADGEQARLHRVGRDYMVRGVKLGRGSFHAKTYFFGNDRDGLLLVGSGNLDLRGLEQGHEVFSKFVSTDDQAIGAIRAWRDWMQDLVEQLGDDEVHRRWWDLRSKARWLAGPAAPSSFVSTAEASMLLQLRQGLPDSVDELHALAPFMDRHAAALRDLVEAVHPRQFHLYICHNLSVDGAALAAVIRGLECDVSLWTFEPDQFVHAKLVGVVWGDQGKLVAGSANLSRAAMTASRATEAWANVEAGVILTAPAEAVRALFRPPRLSLQPFAIDAVSTLTYREPVEAAPRPYHLRFARRLDDGRVEVSIDPVPPADAPIQLTDGLLRSPLNGAQTAGAMPVGDRAALVWLEDHEGIQLSNAVALDDPEALAAWLQEPTQKVDKPRELDAADLDSPVGAMLQRLHRACIFDVDETAAVSTAQRMLDAGGAEEADPDFWDRLVQEELALDRRVAAYHRFGLALPIDEDEILLLLREMLDRTPTHHASLGPTTDPGEEEQENKGGTPWTPAQRLQVRLLHVLERWSRATNDPRLRWVNPVAPVRNYVALLQAIAECWENRYLPEPKLLAVLKTLFQSFVTGEETSGFLLTIDDPDRAAALQRLPVEARTLATALIYVALRPDSNWQRHVFEWQMFVIPGIELGVFQARDGCDTTIERMSGMTVSLDGIDDRLIQLAEYVDDAHWCARLQRELDLDSVAFQSATFAPPFKLAVAVRGIDDPLTDPRLVALARRTFQYKRTPGMVIMGPDWRMSIADGEPAHVRLPSGEVLESTRRVTASYLATLDQQRLGLGDIFAPGQEAAS